MKEYQLNRGRVIGVHGNVTGRRFQMADLVRTKAKIDAQPLVQMGTNSGLELEIGRVCARVTRSWIENRTLYVEIDPIDTPMGKILSAIWQEDCRTAIVACGTGFAGPQVTGYELCYLALSEGA